MTNDRQEHDLPLDSQGPEDLLSAYLFEELDAEAREALDAQLATDVELAARLDALRHTLSMLRRASMDAGPVELSDARREALRAEARQAQGDAGGLREDDGLGRVLHFPWLRAAAGLLVVVGGVALYQGAGGFGGGSAYSVGSHADSEARAELSTLGYIDGAGSTSEPANKSQYGAPARTQNNGPDLSQLGYASTETSIGGGAGGRFRGPGDSVPPRSETAQPSGDALFFSEPNRNFADTRNGLATIEPSAPAAPATPTTPSTPATPAPPSTPPPPQESQQADVGYLVKDGVTLGDQPQAEQNDRSRTELGVPTTDSLEALSLELSGETAVNERRAVAQLERRRELGRRGFQDQWVELGYIQDESGGLSFDADEMALQRYAWLMDGFGESYEQEQILLHLQPQHENESPHDMFFRYYGDNAFVNAAQDQVSTFAVDVDTASYPLARNYLNNGQLPPRAAVRTEEVVNYFDQGLVAPQEDIFTVDLAAAPTPYGNEPNSHLLRVGVKAIEVSRQERLPMNLVFVVDKSGSMRKQNRLGLVQRSLELLLDQMRDDDKIGIVSFDTSGHIVQESVTGAQRWQAREALRKLNAGGSTNAAEGLFLGYEMLDRHFVEGGINRVVLASDGVANTGETDQERILEEVADFTARQVDLTTIGVGMGNHNDVFLEQLANKGNGSCHYVDSFDEARRVFLDEFEGTMQTVARDVKIQVEFDAERVVKWRQIGYENRSLTDEQFRDDTVDAGEVGAGHEVVALYELELADELAQPTLRAGLEVPADALATVRMRWQPDPAFEASRASVQSNAITQPKLIPSVVEREWTLDASSIQRDWDETPSRFRLAAAAAQYAEFLRRSYHVRGDDYARLEAELDRLARELDADAQVRELRDLVHRTRDLVRWKEPGGELWQLIEESRRITMLQQELRQTESRNEETEELLVELLEQNAKLEERIRKHLEGSGD